MTMAIHVHSLLHNSNSFIRELNTQLVNHKFPMNIVYQSIPYPVFSISYSNKDFLEN